MGNISRLYQSGIYPNQPNNATQVALELDNIIGNGVNDNDTRISTNASDVAGLEGRMSSAESDIANHESRLDVIESGTSGYVEVAGSSYTLAPGDPNDIYLSYEGPGTFSVPDPSPFSLGETFWIHTNNHNLSLWQMSIFGGHSFDQEHLRPGEAVILTALDTSGVRSWSVKVVDDSLKSVIDIEYDGDPLYVMRADEHPGRVPSFRMNNNSTASADSLMELYLPDLEWVRTGESYDLWLNMNGDATYERRIYIRYAAADGGGILVDDVNSPSPGADNRVFAWRIVKNTSTTWLSYRTSTDLT